MMKLPAPLAVGLLLATVHLIACAGVFSLYHFSHDPQAALFLVLLVPLDPWLGGFVSRGAGGADVFSRHRSSRDCSMVFSGWVFTRIGIAWADARNAKRAGTDPN
jgi:hypothetical protein